MLENTNRKLKEMSQFFEQMRSSKNVDEFEGHFAAFISAGRSVTFSLQSDLSNNVKFSEWYLDKQQNMKEDELLKFFKDLRDSNIHTGKQSIESSIFIKGPVDSKCWDRPEGSRIKITNRGIYYIKNPNTSLEKTIPAQIPNDVVSTLVLKNSPIKHEGKVILDQHPINLCELYLTYLEKIVEEAQIFFGDNGANKN